jgi:uroporphyrinogen decarboxylase
MAAVAHKTTDRTPITFDAQAEVFDALYKHFGHRSRERLFDALHCDTWMVSPKKVLPPGAPKDGKSTIWGWHTVTAYYTGGKYEEVSWSPLAGKDELSDIDKHNWPDLSSLDFSHFPAEIEAHKDRAIIAPWSLGSYFVASYVRGMENLMMDFAANPAYAEKLIRTITERVLALLDKMLDGYGTGIDIVYMADDTCSQLGPLFSPDTFKRMVVPYLREIVAHVHRHDKKFLLHTCGSVRTFLPMIIECGVDMLEPIQIRAEGMDPRNLKRDFGKHLCFYGGVDLQQVLRRGTPQTVADEVRRLIDILGEGGGYIVGPGHTYIQVDASLENILAMYQAAYEHRAATPGNSR